MTADKESPMGSLELPLEVEQALDRRLDQWADDARLPPATLARIRRAVLADDSAYEPLTVQWWKRVLLGDRDAVRSATDVRTYLEPAWGQA